MSYKSKDRIDRIQGAHPWMLEREVRHLLVGAYAVMTEGYGCTREELHEGMEVYVDGLCNDSRSNLEDLLRDTGGLAD